MTVHLPLAFYSGVFGGARLSSLVGRDERRAPLKTPEWEANLPLDSVKFCVMFKDFVWATWGSDMKIVIEFPRNVFHSSEKSGNPATKSQKTIKKLKKKLPSTIYLDCSQSSIFSWDRLDIPRLTVTGILIFKLPRGRASGIIALGGRGGQINRGTVITSLQLAFTERVVPATQAFDWSLDNGY